MVPPSDLSLHLSSHASLLWRTKQHLSPVHDDTFATLSGHVSNCDLASLGRLYPWGFAFIGALWRKLYSVCSFFVGAVCIFLSPWLLMVHPPQLRQTIQFFRTSHSIEKLDGSNYSTWASNITLCISGLGHKSHLTTSAEFIPEAERGQWVKIDCQLCSVIRSTLHPSNRFSSPTTFVNWFGVRRVVSTRMMLNSYTTCVETWWPS